MENVKTPAEKAHRFFNTTLGISMLPDGQFIIKTLTEREAQEWLRSNTFANVANPTHANSLQAITQRVGVDVRKAGGGRVSLSEGDECLVAQISGIPRETREFTDEEIAAAKFEFRLVAVLSETEKPCACPDSQRDLHGRCQNHGTY